MLNLALVPGLPTIMTARRLVQYHAIVLVDLIERGLRERQKREKQRVNGEDSSNPVCVLGGSYPMRDAQQLLYSALSQKGEVRKTRTQHGDRGLYKRLDNPP